MKTKTILLALLIFCMSLAGCVSQSDGVAEVTLTDIHGTITLQCSATNQNGTLGQQCDDDDPNHYWNIVSNITTIDQSAGHMIKIHSTTGPAGVSGYGLIRFATQCSDGGESGWIYLDGIGPHGSVEESWSNYNQSILCLLYTSDAADE